MTTQEIAETLEVRIYAVVEEKSDWAVGVFPKNGNRLITPPSIFPTRLKAVKFARSLSNVSGMQVVEKHVCQDESFDYETVIARRLFLKALLIGAALFGIYFFLVRHFQ